jgi:CubicO group peptidase (beta-lactamase class C family)
MRTLGSFAANTRAAVACATLVLSAVHLPADAEDLTNALHAFLQQRVLVQKLDTGLVVGLVDDHGSRIVSCGKPDNGGDREIDGDSLFQIGSVTKTFTALLLHDLIARGEMKLDDPTSKYLPPSVKTPTRNGKEITLRHLVLHTSGLPANPSDLGPSWVDYSVEKLYAFLSGYKLRHDPGERYHYSNLGASLLGRAIALRAGTNYESLVIDRICRPLSMNRTRIADPDRSPVFYGQGGLGSTANDLLKYVSAFLGLAQTPLAPIIDRTRELHVQAGAPTQNLGSWFVVADPTGRQFVLHDGDAGHCSAYVAFEPARRRGVVVLSSSPDPDAVASLGAALLQSEWQSDKRPNGTRINRQLLHSYTGQYQRTGMPGAGPQAGIALRRDGDRLLAQAIGPRAWPMRALFPGVEGELLAETKDRLFARLTGIPITFSRDAQHDITGLTVHLGGQTFDYQRISDQPPSVPQPAKQPTAITLAPQLLDAYVGHYEFATNGMKLTLRRDGDKLVSQAWVEDDTDGPVDVFPESETHFFDYFGNQWTFVKNSRGEVTVVILHGANFPDWEGKRVSDAVR